MDRTGHDSAGERATRLWREHRGWISAVLYAHAPRGVDLDDLLQEVAMTLVKHIDSIDSPEKVGPWLRTVAINTARDAGRRHRTKQRVLAEQMKQAATGDAHASGIRTVNTADDAQQRGKDALAIAHSLPPEYREPLMLSLRGLSYQQVSRVLELPVSTIETRLFRARAMVREELTATEQRADRPGATACSALPAAHGHQSSATATRNAP